MAANMSLEIPEDPSEAAAFLEQQLATANDRCSMRKHASAC